MTRKMQLTVKVPPVYGKDLEGDLARADEFLYQMENLFDEIESDLNWQPKPFDQKSRHLISLCFLIPEMILPVFKKIYASFRQKTIHLFS